MWWTYELSTDDAWVKFSKDYRRWFVLYLKGKKDIDYFFNDKHLKTIKKVLEELKREYDSLNKRDKRKFRKIFLTNQEINKGLNNELKFYKYESFEYLKRGLKDKVNKVDDYLYKKLKDLKWFEKNYDSPKEHYNKLINNNKVCCPICGGEMIDPKEKWREDFDHYIDKATYPFVSLNANNLVPMCKVCNQNEKASKNILSYTPFIYPFGSSLGHFVLTILKIDIGEELNYKISLSETLNEKFFNNFDNIFNIKDRIKIKLERSRKAIEKELIRAEKKNDISLEKYLEVKLEIDETEKLWSKNIFEISLLEYYSNNLDYIRNLVNLT